MNRLLLEKGEEKLIIRIIFIFHFRLDSGIFTIAHNPDLDRLDPIHTVHFSLYPYTALRHRCRFYRPLVRCRR